jgi:hypothetical protein
MLLRRVGKWAVATKLVTTIEYGNELIQSGYAEEYKGEFPPKKKHKMNLSQLKIK